MEPTARQLLVTFVGVRSFFGGLLFAFNRDLQAKCMFAIAPRTGRLSEQKIKSGVDDEGV